MKEDIPKSCQLPSRLTFSSAPSTPKKMGCISGWSSAWPSAWPSACFCRNFSEKPPVLQEKAGHRLAKTGSKSRKFEGEGATSKECGPWGGASENPRTSRECCWGIAIFSTFSNAERRRRRKRIRQTSRNVALLHWFSCFNTLRKSTFLIRDLVFFLSCDMCIFFLQTQVLDWRKLR